MVGLAVLVGTASPALSHPYLLRSQPPANSVVASSPATIVITYTEALDRPYCKVVLVASNGRHIGTHQVHASGSSQLTVVPDQALGQGTFAVLWTAVGGDGHTVTGGFGVSVGHPSANANVPAVALPNAGSAANQGEILRTLLPLATVALAGVLLLAGELADATGGERRLARRAAGVRWALWGILAAVLVGLSVQSVADQGLSPFNSSSSGRRLLLQLVLVAAALPAVAESALRAGRRPGRLARTDGVLVSLALLTLLALSGHAATQTVPHRAVYALHLVAVSVWAGAIVAVVLPLRQGAYQRLVRLRGTVGASIVAVVVTGYLNTDWAMRGLSHVGSTVYGRLVVTKFVLYGVMVGLGVAAAVGLRRRPRLVIGEAVLGVSVLVLAGVLGQVPQPRDVPFASQVNAASVGVPVSVSPAGDALVTGLVTPGVVGRNRIVVGVSKADGNDFAHPLEGIQGLSVRVQCGCPAPAQLVSLHPVADSPWWAGDADLPVAATWSLTAAFHVEAETGPARLAELSAHIQPATLPSQVVVGVAADLSGAGGRSCLDQVLGLQAALADVNERTLDHGRLVRVVAADVHDGVAPALDRLQALHPVALALPCGTDQEVNEILDGAGRFALPIVDTKPAINGTRNGVWSLGASWTSEGRLIGQQMRSQQPQNVVIVAGPTAIDRQEVAGVTAELDQAKLPHLEVGLPPDPNAFVARMEAVGVDAAIVLANPAEALPFARGLSTQALKTTWQPPHGVLASAQLLDTNFINDAGQITRLGGISFASDVNPFDPIDQYYAQRLRQLVPGLRPTFDGVHGYTAGWVLANALSFGGGHPTPSRLAQLLSSRFTKFGVGSYRGHWTATGGGATQMGFFRSTFLNPMAMPADSPGGALSLAHEGTFLNAGGFEQLAPFTNLP